VEEHPKQNKQSEQHHQQQQQKYYLVPERVETVFKAFCFSLSSCKSNL